MAKSAKFDRQQVIDKATALYWQKGFHATSMRHLQDIVDMRPGSIYAAFGSKEGLFKETLQNYKQAGMSQLAECRANSPSPITALKMFMRKLVIEASHDAPSGICMLAKTVAELTDEHQALLNEARRLLCEMEHAFQQLIAEAQELGEIDQSKDPARLAAHIQVQISGLRIYGKLHAGDALLETTLEQMIDDVFAYHPFSLFCP